MMIAGTLLLSHVTSSGGVTKFWGGFDLTSTWITIRPYEIVHKYQPGCERFAVGWLPYTIPPTYFHTIHTMCFAQSQQMMIYYHCNILTYVDWGIFPQAFIINHHLAAGWPDPSLSSSMGAKGAPAPTQFHSDHVSIVQSPPTLSYNLQHNFVRTIGIFIVS